jgi:outer membrane protein assembly factor BamE (lipoprotein component of BamABCDE complex)
VGRALVVAAVLALALTASSARAAIVVQRSIGGVALNMTKAQVRAKLGRPMRVHVGTNEFGAFTERVFKRVTVTFQSGDRVTNVRTTSPLEQTASGVGVGSTKFQVKAGVHNVTCKNESGFKHCFVGAFLPGRTVTDFRLRSRRVSSVSIGFVID